MSQNETQTRRFFNRVGDVLGDFLFFLRTFLDDILAALFSFSRLAGILRFILFFMGGLAFWIFYTSQTRELAYWDLVFQEVGKALLPMLSDTPGVTFLNSSVRAMFYFAFALGSLFKNMFSVQIMRHVVAIVVPVFIAARVAVIYLADIFELDSEKISFRFLFQATFALGYRRLIIEDGSVSPDYRESPMLRIGGPGSVQVNLENVAVFDRINGDVHLMPPTNDKWRESEVIASFERLREVIDLRDQITSASGIEVSTRTKDGIRIFIKDVRLKYSVMRDRNNDDELSFDEGAVERLVYRRSVGPWKQQMINLVRSQLRQFVSEHNLSDFLASADIPVFDQTTTISTPVTDGATNFVPRPNITQRFLSRGFQRRAEQLGLELDWIDIGTWSAPTQLIQDRHLKAWKITCQNVVRRRELDKVYQEAYTRELLHLIREFPLVWYQEAQMDEEVPDTKSALTLIKAYLGLLRSAEATYPEDEVPPALTRAIDYLTHYINRYLDDSGQVRFLGDSE